MVFTLIKLNDGFMRKTEHFKALAKNDNTSAIDDHVNTTRHSIKWDHFDVLAKGQTDYQRKVKEAFNIYSRT